MKQVFYRTSILKGALCLFLLYLILQLVFFMATPNNIKSKQQLIKLQNLHKKKDQNVADSIVHTTCPASDEKFVFEQVIQGIYVYSAFWDKRVNDFDNLNHLYFVRIIAMADKRVIHQQPRLFCIFSNSSASSINFYEMAENHNKRYGGYIFSCKVPPDIEVPPCTFILSTNEANNNRKGIVLKINTNVGSGVKEKVFVTCVPPLHGSIEPLQLIEWIELSVLLGTQHIIFYNNLHDNFEMTEIMKYYTDKKIITVYPWNIGPYENDIWYHGQILAINDCLYRNMYGARYLMFNDLDELLVPHLYANLTNLLMNIDRDNQGGFSFGTAYFPPSANSGPNSDESVKLACLQDIRVEHVDFERRKVMVKAPMVFEMGIHHISRRIFGNVIEDKVDLPVAVLHHYRECLLRNVGLCGRTLKDATLRDRFGDALVKRIQQHPVGKKLYQE